VSLRVRLALLIALAVAGGLSLQGVLGYFVLEQSMRADLDRDLGYLMQDISRHVRTQGGNLRLPSIFGDTLVLTRITKGARVILDSADALPRSYDNDAHPGVDAMTLPDGSLASGFPEPVGGVAPQPHSVGPWRVQVLPLGDGSQLEGAISNRQYASSLELYRRTVTWTSLALAALGALGALWLARRALLPLLSFTATAGRIAESGDLRSRMPVVRGGELGRLSDTLNLMLERLEGFRAREAEFVRHASHELRTPLTVLAVNLDAERAGFMDARETLQEVRGQVSRMRALTESLLLLAHEGRTELEPLDLAGLTARIAARTEVQYLGPSTLRVTGNAVLLERALENLLENARKHAPGSQVTVCLEGNHKRVRLSVSDDGPGLAAEALERATEAFYRAPGTRVAGSGLGLAVVAQIAEAHGGGLRVENRQLRGLTVTLEWQGGLSSS
jgi:signal transduction histidine kinase